MRVDKSRLEAMKNLVFDESSTQLLISTLTKF